MKKFLKGFIALSLGLAMVGCAKEYDDTALKSKVDELSSDVNTLKAQQKAMQAVIDVWKAGGYIASIDDSVPGQHTITFYGDNGKAVVLYDGEDGEQGPACEDGDAYFKSIVTDENGVTFTLNDEEGTSFTIPFAKAFKLVINNLEAEVEAGKAVEFPYEIQNANATTTVDVFAGGNYVAAVNATESKIVVTPPTPAVNGSVLAWAQNEEGLFSMKKLSFIVKANTEVTTTQEELEAIPSEANEFVVNVVSNIDIDVEKPTVDWVSVVVTKADYKLTLTLAENTTGAPRETEIIVVRKDNGAQVQKIKIVQLYSEPEPDPVVYYVFDGAAGKHGISTKVSTYQPYAWTASNAMETIPAGYLENADWKVTLGNVQDNGKGDFWFGANSGNKDKLTFGNSEYAEAKAIAAALDVKTDAKHYGALICTSNLPTISKIEITSTAEMGGGQATTMWVVKSTDNGNTYSVVKKIDSPAKAANTLFTIKIAKADRSASASYALVFYREGGQFQYKAPQITFYSADPTTVVTEKVLTLEKVFGIHGVAGVAGWPAYVTSGSLADVLDDNTQARNATFDSEFVYVAQSESIAANGDETPLIHKFKISDGTYAGAVQKCIDPAYMAGSYCGIHPVSVVRFMENSNADINGGKPVLIAINLGDGGTHRVYAWVNGTNNEPRLLANFSNGRRLGDKVSVEGNYQDGKLWFRSNDGDGMVCAVIFQEGWGAKYPNNDEKSFKGADVWNWVEARGKMPVDDVNNISEYYPFGKTTYGLIATNSGVGLHLMDGTTEKKLYPEFKRCFGWHGFEFNGKSYIAFTNVGTKDGAATNKPIVTVIEGAYDTVDNLQATLDAFKVVARASIASADPNDFDATTTYLNNNTTECQVRIIDGVPYILGMTRGGIALFKLVLK